MSSCGHREGRRSIMRGGASLSTRSSPPHGNVRGAAKTAAFTLVCMCKVTAAHSSPQTSRRADLPERHLPPSPGCKRSTSAQIAQASHCYCLFTANTTRLQHRSLRTGGGVSAVIQTRADVPSGSHPVRTTRHKTKQTLVSWATSFPRPSSTSM